jgi:peptidoglycan hydrolase CwlO-like protein
MGRPISFKMNPDRVNQELKKTEQEITALVNDIAQEKQQLGSPQERESTWLG